MGEVVARAAVSAAIRNDMGELLLVKRGCEPHKGLWSLPGGSVEPGEAIADAARREALEETSLDVEIGEIAGVYDVISYKGSEIAYHYVIVCFHAVVIGGEAAAASDAADVGWFAKSDLESLDVTPGLFDRLRGMGLL